MPFTERTWYLISQSILEVAEEYSTWLLERLRANANKAIRDSEINTIKEIQEADKKFESFMAKVDDWTDEELSKAYLRGIKKGDIGNNLTAGAFGAGLLAPSVISQIRERAVQVLSDYPQHHTMYGAFQQAVRNDFENTRPFILRQQRDRLRDLTIQASDSAYRNADPLTRRQLTQELMTAYSKEGITGVRYSDGRMMKLDSYAEMVARSQTGNAARQATMNRLQEYGMDLVVISQHYPVSPLCEDWQGRVYSISGTDPNYPALETAISGGLYHSNCKHSQSGYSRGDKIPEAREEVGKKENERRYEATQRQRQIERKIRQYKREVTSAVDPKIRERKQKLVSKWQAKARENIEANPWMRRYYSRESI
jgi:hypothetical protein